MNIRSSDSWNNTYCDDDDVISRIDGSDRLVAVYGRWPTFTDSEILSLKFLRGNKLQCMRDSDWDNVKGVCIEAILYTFDDRYSERDLRRRPTLVVMTFNNVDELQVDGFNYQNSVCGLGIRREKSIRLDSEVFRVSWGGAAVQHDVGFICEQISVNEVSEVKTTAPQIIDPS